MHIETVLFLVSAAVYSYAVGVPDPNVIAKVTPNNKLIFPVPVTELLVNGNFLKGGESWTALPCSYVTVGGCVEKGIEVDTKGHFVNLNPNGKGPGGVYQQFQVPKSVASLTVSFQLGYNTTCSTPTVPSFQPTVVKVPQKKPRDVVKPSNATQTNVQVPPNVKGNNVSVKMSPTATIPLTGGKPDEGKPKANVTVVENVPKPAPTIGLRLSRQGLATTVVAAEYVASEVFTTYSIQIPVDPKDGAITLSVLSKTPGSCGGRVRFLSVHPVGKTGQSIMIRDGEEVEEGENVSDDINGRDSEISEEEDGTNDRRDENSEGGEEVNGSLDDRDSKFVKRSRRSITLEDDTEVEADEEDPSLHERDGEGNDEGGENSDLEDRDVEVAEVEGENYEGTEEEDEHSSLNHRDEDADADSEPYSHLEDRASPECSHGPRDIFLEDGTEVEADDMEQGHNERDSDDADADSEQLVDRDSSEISHDRRDIFLEDGTEVEADDAEQGHDKRDNEEVDEESEYHEFEKRDFESDTESEDDAKLEERDSKYVSRGRRSIVLEDD
ncbi:hypothetical protein HDU99_004233, partial [Rhizoclosmatium hyalinum]